MYAWSGIDTKLFHYELELTTVWFYIYGLAGQRLLVVPHERPSSFVLFIIEGVYMFRLISSYTVLRVNWNQFPSYT